MLFLPDFCTASSVACLAHSLVFASISCCFLSCRPITYAIPGLFTAGRNCSIEATCYNVQNCSSNGQCVGVDVCQCNTGWNSTTCSQVSCEALGHCSGEIYCMPCDWLYCTLSGTIDVSTYNSSLRHVLFIGSWFHSGTSRCGRWIGLMCNPHVRQKRKINFLGETPNLTAGSPQLTKSIKTLCFLILLFIFYQIVTK